MVQGNRTNRRNSGTIPPVKPIRKEKGKAKEKASALVHNLSLEDDCRVKEKAKGKASAAALEDQENGGRNFKVGEPTSLTVLPTTRKEIRLGRTPRNVSTDPIVGR